MKLESTLNSRPGMGYIAPLLDVVMLLLIFFLLSSQFIQRSGYEVEPPFSKSTLEALVDADMITVPTGTIEEVMLNDARVPIGKLDERLKERALLSRHIVIRVDKATPHWRVVDMINFAADAGFKNIAVATSPEPD